MGYEEESLVFPDLTDGEVRDANWHNSKMLTFEAGKIAQKQTFVIESNHDQPLRAKIQASLHRDFSRPFDLGPEDDKEFTVPPSPGAGAYDAGYTTLSDFFIYMRVSVKADIAPLSGSLEGFQLAITG